ncbi:MAG TPA: hypothetical protein DCF66_02870, partial [Lachnospiraceae bacterium]|nr:hypothetical protein [Lachnospiraceae bacterium]
VNQLEQPRSAAKAMRYKPQNIAELSALVAALRPGFKSMVDAFLNREPFSYGIKALDSLLRGPEGDAGSWLLYQEQIMSIARYAGIPPGDGYKLIKAISKKKLPVIESFHTPFICGLEERGVDWESAEKVWGIVNDSASYMFNASHSYSVACDSLYAAYLKAHHPLNFYRTFMEICAEKGKKDKIALARAEALRGFGIRLIPPRFRQDNRSFQIDREKNAIVDVLSSAKGMRATAASELYRFRSSYHAYFCDLIYEIYNETSLTGRMIEILIRSNYFEEFGGNAKLFRIWREIREGRYRWSEGLKSLEERKELIRRYEKQLPDERFPVRDQVRFEIQTYGSPLTIHPDLTRTLYAVTDVSLHRGVSVQLFNLRTGATGMARVKKRLFEPPRAYAARDLDAHAASGPDGCARRSLPSLEPGCVIEILRYDTLPACTYEGGKRVPIRGTREIWLKEWTVLSDTETLSGSPGPGLLTGSAADKKERSPRIVLHDIRKEEDQFEQISFLN